MGYVSRKEEKDGYVSDPMYKFVVVAANRYKTYLRQVDIFCLAASRRMRCDHGGYPMGK
jgi:hypothetical protein